MTARRRSAVMTSPAALLGGFVYDQQHLGLDAALSASWADLARALDALPEEPGGD
jgi:hypothetical protein